MTTMLCIVLYCIFEHAKWRDWTGLDYLVFSGHILIILDFFFTPNRLCQSVSIENWDQVELL